MRALLCSFVLALVAGAAGAEIYQWTDASGRVHFTQDLGQVPPQQRKAAEERASRGSSGPSRVHTYSGSTGRAAPRPSFPASAGASERVHKIQVQRAGSSMLVEVRLNDTVTAPFLLDTGASDVLLPKQVADQLGLEMDAARTKRYSTANGTVEHPVVMLRSVALGGARVENVPASVSPSMGIGLLGLSFFNHFNYNIDAANGVVTLRRNALESSGQIRGGRSQAQWSAEYRNLHGRMERVRWEYEGKAEHKTRERRRLERALEELERQLALLEEEADRARVPMAWRR